MSVTHFSQLIYQIVQKRPKSGLRAGHSEAVTGRHVVLTDSILIEQNHWKNYKLASFRPTQSIMYIPFQVNICHKSILLILQYKYLKSFSDDFILKNPTKIRFSAQDHVVLLLLLNTVGFFISARQKSAWLK